MYYIGSKEPELAGIWIKIYLNPKKYHNFSLIIYSRCLEGSENKMLDKTTLTDHSGPEVKEQLLEI